VHSSERASELLFCFPERSALQAVSMSDTNLFLIGNNGASESFSRENVSQQSSCLPFSILHPRRFVRMEFLPKSKIKSAYGYNIFFRPGRIYFAALIFSLKESSLELEYPSEHREYDID
jgi:hypothetical protein